MKNNKLKLYEIGYNIRGLGGSSATELIAAETEDEAKKYSYSNQLPVYDLYIEEMGIVTNKNVEKGILFYVED